MDTFDVVIIGAGAAGMMCAFQAGRRGRKVALLEHSTTLGRKILISGGGRCNFTNIGTGPAQFISKNPEFCKSALARFTPEDFIRMVQTHGISFHEKKLGQLFCDRSAQEIVDLLVAECTAAGVTFHIGCQVRSITREAGRFLVQSTAVEFCAESLVIATGGLSLPKIGATDFGYRVAEQFGLKVVAPAPALDGFVFAHADQKHFEGLAGVSLEAIVSCAAGGRSGFASSSESHGGISFRENILFTHSGLSGPAALQSCLYWRPDDTVTVNFLPGFARGVLMDWFLGKKRVGARAEIKNLLAELLPKSFCEKFCDAYLPNPPPVAQLPAKTLEEFCRRLQNWQFIPAGTVGYQRAEVTRGGVDTDELSSKTMEAQKTPGLYFIGEVVDVTGWLGGYNFQWAWASGWAAGQTV